MIVATGEKSRFNACGNCRPRWTGRNGLLDVVMAQEAPFYDTSPKPRLKLALDRFPKVFVAC